jgi:hypothetical protein
MGGTEFAGRIGEFFPASQRLHWCPDFETRNQAAE